MSLDDVHIKYQMEVDAAIAALTSLKKKNEELAASANQAKDAIKGEEQATESNSEAADKDTQSKRRRVQAGRASINTVNAMRETEQRLQNVVNNSRIGTQRYIQNLERLRNVQSQIKKVNDSTTQSYSKMGNTLNNLKGQIAAAFAVGTIINYSKEAINLAVQLKSVEIAFRRVADENILKGLRAATKGTVSDLELMKSANLGASFGLPMDKLAELAEFATLKAAETGQSVDYMWNSVVTGIARGSILILDNLGISSREISEGLDGATARSAEIGKVTEVVANIAKKQIEGMRKSWDEVNGSIAANKTSMENMKAAFGQNIIPIQAGLMEFANAAMTQARYFGDSWIAAFGDIKNASNEGVLALARTDKKFREFEAGFNMAFGELSRDNLADFKTKLMETYELSEETVRHLEKSGGSILFAKTPISAKELADFKEFKKVLSAMVDEAIKAGNNMGGLTDEIKQQNAQYQKQIDLLGQLKPKQTNVGAEVFTKTDFAMFGSKPSDLGLDEIKEALSALEVEFDKAVKGSDHYNKIIARTAELTNEASRRTEAWSKIISRIGVVSGSVMDLTLRMSELQKQQEKATTPEQWQAVADKIVILQKQLDTINGTSLKEMADLVREISHMEFLSGATDAEKAIFDIEKKYGDMASRVMKSIQDPIEVFNQLDILDKAKAAELSKYQTEKQKEALAQQEADRKTFIDRRISEGVATTDELYNYEVSKLKELLNDGIIRKEQYDLRMSVLNTAYNKEAEAGIESVIAANSRLLEIQLAYMQAALKSIPPQTKEWYEMRDAIAETEDALANLNSTNVETSEKTKTLLEMLKESWDNVDWNQVGGALRMQMQQAAQQVLQIQERKNREEVQAELAKNDQLLRDGKITQEEKDQLDIKAKKEAAERSKELAKYNAALAVAEAFLMGLLQGGLATALIYSALALGQQAIINSVAVPEFAGGVFRFQGKGTETSDSNLVKISHNESVASAHSTNKYGDILKPIIHDDEAGFKKVLWQYALSMSESDKFAQPEMSGNTIVNVKTDNEDLKREIRRSAQTDASIQKAVASALIRELRRGRRNWYN